MECLNYLWNKTKGFECPTCKRISYKEPKRLKENEFVTSFLREQPQEEEPPKKEVKQVPVVKSAPSDEPDEFLNNVWFMWQGIR